MSTTIDRNVLGDKPTYEGLRVHPLEFTDKIASAVDLGQEFDLTCEKVLDNDGIVFTRYRLTVWPKADRTEVREVLAQVALQRARYLNIATCDHGDLYFDPHGVLMCHDCKRAVPDTDDDPLPADTFGAEHSMGQAVR